MGVVLVNAVDLERRVVDHRTHSQPLKMTGKRGSCAGMSGQHLVSITLFLCMACWAGCVDGQGEEGSGGGMEAGVQANSSMTNITTLDLKEIEALGPGRCAQQVDNIIRSEEPRARQARLVPKCWGPARSEQV